MVPDERNEEQNDTGSGDQIEEVKFEPVDDTPLTPAEEAAPQIQGDLQPTEEVVEPAPAEESGENDASLEEVQPEEGAEPDQESAGKEETSEVAVADVAAGEKKAKTLGKSATARYQEHISKQMSPKTAKKLKLSLIIAIPILIVGLSALVVWKYIQMNAPKTPVVHEVAGDEELKRVLTDAETQHLKAMQLWNETMGWEANSDDLEKMRVYKQKADEAIALIDATIKLLNDKHKEWVERNLRVVEGGAKYEETVTAERYGKEKEEKMCEMIRGRMGRKLAALEASQGGKTPEPVAPVQPPNNAVAPEPPKETPPVAEQPKKPGDIPIIESGKKPEEPIDQPEKPAEPKPEEPIAQPEKPAEPKPEEPIAQPEKPAEPKPEEPIAQPEKPAEPKPEEPIAQPEKPAEPKPEEPIAQPEKPAEPKPEEPIAQPEKPAEPKPEEPIAQPEKPAEPKPEEPIAQPEKPAEPKPEEPIAQPEKPAEPKPEEPIAQPEKPAEPKPEEPIAQPEKPAEPKPEEPIAQPEKPAEPKPEVAVKPVEPPAKPPVREPVINPSDIILDGAHNTVIQTSKVFVDTIQKAINPPFDAGGGFDKKEVAEIIKSLEAIQGMLTKASEDYKKVREQQPDAKYAYLDENIRRITNINTFIRERIGVLRTIVKEEKVVAPPEKAPEPAPAPVPEKKEEAKPPEGVPVQPAPGEPVEPGKEPAPPVEPEKKEAAPVEPEKPAPENPVEPGTPEVKPPEAVPPSDGEKPAEPKAGESEPGKAEEPKAEEPKAPDAPAQPDKPAEPGQ